MITTEEGKSHVLPIADADAFVFNVDKMIGEYKAQGGPLAMLDKFDIK